MLGTLVQVQESKVGVHYVYSTGTAEGLKAAGLTERDATAVGGNGQSSFPSKLSLGCCTVHHVNNNVAAARRI